MEKWASWQLFFIGLGFLAIVFAPQSTQPMVMIIGGLCIILLGIIIMKKSAKKERNKKGKW